MSINWTFWPSDPFWSDTTFWDWRPPWIRPSVPGTMRWALQQTAVSTVEPIDLATAKNHLRVLYTDEDTLIENLITVAREYTERKAGVSLLTQTWQLYLDRWPRLDRFESWPWMAPPGTILLPRYPVQSVTSIQWFGTDGSTNTVASTDYVLDAASRIARIVPAATKSWPSTPALVPQNGVIVTFTAGYGATQTSLPPTLRQAMLLLLGHWYGNREDTVVGTRLVAISIPKSVDALLGINQPPLVG